MKTVEFKRPPKFSESEKIALKKFFENEDASQKKKQQPYYQRFNKKMWL